MTNLIATIIVYLHTNTVDIAGSVPPLRVAYIERRRELLIQYENHLFTNRLGTEYIQQSWLEQVPPPVQAVGSFLSTTETIKPTLPEIRTADGPQVDGTKPIAAP